MCIRYDNTTAVEKQKLKSGQLTLWKVVRKDNRIGLWKETYGVRDAFNEGGHHDIFNLGINIPEGYCDVRPVNGRYHCFLSRKAARLYLKHRATRGFYARPNHKSYAAKIIKVFVDRTDIVEIGRDGHTHLAAISVSKMEIKSLKHQR